MKGKYIVFGLIVGLLVGWMKPTNDHPNEQIKGLEYKVDSLQNEISLNNDSISSIELILADYRDKNDSLYNYIQHKQENYIQAIKQHYEKKFNHIDTCDLSGQVEFFTNYISKDSIN